MKRFQNKVVVITGASSGIGAALARAFYREGAHLALLARRIDRLEELKREFGADSQKILCLQCDVTEQKDIEVAYQTVVRELGKIDVVVANAGFGVVGRVERLEIADYERQFDTNVFGVLRTVKPAIAELRKTKGRIGIVGSVNGYVALYANSPYAMSKFAVRALSDSLRLELRSDEISVTHIAPGFVKSEIQKVDNQGVFHPEAKDWVPTWLKMDTDRAARKMVNALYFRCTERIVTGHGHLIVWTARFFPWIFRYALRTQALSSRKPLPIKP